MNALHKMVRKHYVLHVTRKRLRLAQKNYATNNFSGHPEEQLTLIDSLQYDIRQLRG